MKRIFFMPKANLRRYVGMAERIECQAEEGDTLIDILRRTAIPEDAVMGFVRDGVLLERDRVPPDGEVVEIYPAISGG